MRYYLSILFLVGTILPSFSQEIYSISGKVVDAQTKKALELANIGILNTGLGTTTNVDGEFTLNIPKEYLSSNLYFSYVGYNKQRIPIQELKKNRDENIIHLYASTINIDELTVYANLTAENILQKAIKNLENNYSIAPYEQEGFYRNTIQQNTKYVGFTERIFDIYNGGYDEDFGDGKYEALPSDLVRVRQSRNSSYQVKHDDNGDLLFFEPYNLLILKKKVLHEGYLDKKSIKECNLTWEGTIPYGDRKVFWIHFSPKKIPEKYFNQHIYNTLKAKIYEGDLYIDAEDYAIVKIKINNQNYLSSFQKLKNPHTNYTSKEGFKEFIIQYSRYKEKYYLSYISLINEYDDDSWATKVVPDKIRWFEELIITNFVIETGDEQYLRYKFGAFSQFGAVKVPQSKYQELIPYQPEFWQSYAIPPFSDWDRLKLDLEKLSGDSLTEQFEKSAKVRLLSKQEIDALTQRYSPEYKQYIKNWCEKNYY